MAMTQNVQTMHAKASPDDHGACPSFTDSVTGLKFVEYVYLSK